MSFLGDSNDVAFNLKDKVHCCQRLDLEQWRCDSLASDPGPPRPGRDEDLKVRHKAPRLPVLP